MKKPKIDMSLVTEIAGVALAGYGLFLILPALSFIAVGVFLIYVTEKE
jgi:hypothetical protein